MSAWREYMARFSPEPEPGGAAPQVYEPPPSYWRDEYEERAAIYEYEAGLTREDAERRAYEDTVTAWLFQSDMQGSLAERRAAAVRELARYGITNLNGRQN